MNFLHFIYLFVSVEELLMSVVHSKKGVGYRVDLQYEPLKLSHFMFH